MSMRSSPTHTLTLHTPTYTHPYVQSIMAAGKSDKASKAKQVGKTLKKGMSVRKTRVHTKVHFYRPKTLKLDRQPKVGGEAREGRRRRRQAAAAARR